MEIVTNKTDSVRTGSASENLSLAVCSDANPQHQSTWQSELRSAIRDAGTLCRYLEIESLLPQSVLDRDSKFPVFAPLPFVDRIRRADIHDPLLRQILPLTDERKLVDGFSSDPVQELSATRSEGLIHKYHGRALLIAAKACAVHCRYCFRREFPYETAPNSTDQWQPAIDQIAADSSIEEVILSGGDPLMLVDRRLAALIEQIDAIRHVRRIRLHTRLPVMIPSRVTEILRSTLMNTRSTSVVVIHANHRNELDASVADAVQKFTRSGIQVLNQAVLLQGVNDSVEVLSRLFARLADLQVTPYYLHQLDRVHGAAHFEVPVETGLQLMRELHGTLPGYLLPRYVKDNGGRQGKQILF